MLTRPASPSPMRTTRSPPRAGEPGRRADQVRPRVHVRAEPGPAGPRPDRGRLHPDLRRQADLPGTVGQELVVAGVNGGLKGFKRADRGGYGRADELVGAPGQD